MGSHSGSGFLIVVPRTFLLSVVLSGVLSHALRVSPFERWFLSMVTYVLRTFHPFSVGSSKWFFLTLLRSFFFCGSATGFLTVVHRMFLLLSLGSSQWLSLMLLEHFLLGLGSSRWLLLMFLGHSINLVLVPLKGSFLCS